MGEMEAGRPVPFNVGILPPLSVNYMMGARSQAQNVISADLLVGQAQASQSLQAAGLWAGVSGKASGTQMSGLVAKAGSVNGAQLAGLLNLSGQTYGTQLAGLANVDRGTQSRLIVQTAGLVNVGNRVDVQFAGLFNFARKVKGVQIGLINVADSADYQLGLLNWSRNGTRLLAIYATDQFLVNLEWKSGGAKLYTSVGLGTASLIRDNPYGIHYGIGYRITERWVIELGRTTLYRDQPFGASQDRITQLKPAFWWPLGTRMVLSVGPNFNIMRALQTSESSAPLYHLYLRKLSDPAASQYFWIGGQVAMQIRI